MDHDNHITAAPASTTSPWSAGAMPSGPVPFGSAYPRCRAQALGSVIRA